MQGQWVCGWAWCSERARGGCEWTVSKQGWWLLEFLYLAGGSKQHILAVMDVVEQHQPAGFTLQFIMIVCHVMLYRDTYIQYMYIYIMIYVLKVLLYCYIMILHYIMYILMLNYYITILYTVLCCMLF